MRDASQLAEVSHLIDSLNVGESKSPSFDSDFEVYRDVEGHVFTVHQRIHPPIKMIHNAVVNEHALARRFPDRDFQLSPYVLDAFEAGLHRILGRMAESVIERALICYAFWGEDVTVHIEEDTLTLSYTSSVERDDALNVAAEALEFHIRAKAYVTVDDGDVTSAILQVAGSEAIHRIEHLILALST